jgi:hypothetical protein
MLARLFHNRLRLVKNTGGSDRENRSRVQSNRVWIACQKKAAKPASREAGEHT